MTEPTGKRRRILIIGGGVAGGAAAIGLARGGESVTLVERRRFPRTKVCGGCIGPPGLAELERLGVGEAVRDVAARVDRWRGYAGGRVAELPLPPGVAVCRSRLDPILVDRARHLGCNVRLPATAKLVDPGGDTRPAAVAIDGSVERFDLVLAASGLAGLNLESFAPVTQSPGPIGVAAMVASPTEPGIIHMVMHRDGYVGAVELSPGRVDVAAAVMPRPGVTPWQTVQTILRGEGLECLADAPADGVATTPRLRRRRDSVVGRVWMVGDAHRYVEPMTGQGMTWALISARSACESLIGRDLDDATAIYRHASGRQNDRGQRRCGWITRAVRHPAVHRPAIAMLQHAPWLASPLIRSVNAR